MVATCLGCSGSSGIWNSGCPQDATNKLLELREPMKGHLTKWTREAGRGGWKAEPTTQGQALEQPTATDPRLEPSAERSPRLRSSQEKLCPAAPTGNPPRLQRPGRRLLALQPCFPPADLASKPASQLPLLRKQRSSPCAPHSATVLPQLAGPGWQFSATPE